MDGLAREEALTTNTNNNNTPKTPATRSSKDKGGRFVKNSKQIPPPPPPPPPPPSSSSSSSSSSRKRQSKSQPDKGLKHPRKTFSLGVKTKVVAVVFIHLNHEINVKQNFFPLDVRSGVNSLHAGIHSQKASVRSSTFCRRR